MKQPAAADLGERQLVAVTTSDARQRETLWGRVRRFWARFRADRAGVFGVIIVGSAMTGALFAPALAPHSPFALQPEVLSPPSTAYPFGTDQVGRDVLSNLIFGTRVALVFAIGAAGISLIIGVIVGSIPAYFGGWLDDLVSRVVEMFLMIPQFVLVLTVVALFGNSILYAMVVVGLTIWPSNAKITRSQVLTLKRRMFVRAVEASGAGHLRILFRHILPNGLHPVIANSTLQMAYAILFEASISFFGLGDPNFVSWGQLLFLANLHKSAWWMALFPGLCILLLVLGFNFVGDGINAALNPRLHGRPD
jgi:peptide/nickel transport system permease protein